MSQENLQTMLMQSFWGVKEVHCGIVQVVNTANVVIFTLLFCRGPRGIILKCVPHVQHPYFLPFDQSNS